MNLLIIGGSIFLGRHLVAAALQSGHRVTTFNRGNHILPEQSEVERLVGDRNSIELPAGRTWDVVIDTCGLEPEAVLRSANTLAASVGRYVFISSISAFDNFRQIGLTESSPARLLPPDVEQDYGSRKAHCEKIVSDLYGKKSLIIRPGLIVGPHDTSDRFTYWPRRLARGGQVLAPGRGDRLVQFIDVRDLSEWILRLAEANFSGTYMATGPAYDYSMKAFLFECKRVAGSEAELIWIPDEQLLSADVKPWSELPLWIPESDTDFAGFMQVDCIKAQNTGLSYRRPAESISAVLEWDSGRDQTVPLKAGLDAEKEKALLSTLARV
jgi:2'-hydroxyisoflavone reductase